MPQILAAILLWNPKLEVIPIGYHHRYERVHSKGAHKLPSIKVPVPVSLPKTGNNGGAKVEGDFYDRKYSTF